MGKAATVSSDSFLENYGLGKKHMHLHADNCAGQNKNCHVVFAVASPHWPTCIHNHEFPAYWAHQVLMSLVFWFGEAKVQEN